MLVLGLAVRERPVTATISARLDDLLCQPDHRVAQEVKPTAYSTPAASAASGHHLCAEAAVVPERLFAIDVLPAAMAGKRPSARAARSCGDRHDRPPRDSFYQYLPVRRGPGEPPARGLRRRRSPPWRRRAPPCARNHGQGSNSPATARGIGVGPPMKPEPIQPESRRPSRVRHAQPRELRLSSQTRTMITTRSGLLVEWTKSPGSSARFGDSSP